MHPRKKREFQLSLPGKVLVVHQFLRANERGQAWHHKLVSKYGKAKALSIIAQKLGRVAYIILKKRTAFDAKRFYDSVS